MSFNSQTTFTPFKRKLDALIPNIKPTFQKMETGFDTPTMRMKISEGFKETHQYLFREDNLRLPRHVISIDLPLNYPTDDLLVECSLYRKTHNGYVELEKLAQSTLRFSNENYSCSFDKLIVHHGSNKYGKELCLRFHLLDAFSNKEFSSIQSASFETKTRGNDKKKKKEIKGDFLTIEPSFSPLKGEILVKISGNDIVGDPQYLAIQFGTLTCTTIYVATNDFIICSAPRSTQSGQVAIQISRTKTKKFLHTGLKFKYVNDNEESKKLVIDHFFSKNEKPFKTENQSTEIN